VQARDSALFVQAGVSLQAVGLLARDSVFVKEKELGASKNAVDSAKPEADGRTPLSENDKKKLELGGMMEHEQGQPREKLEEEVEKLDQ